MVYYNRRLKDAIEAIFNEACNSDRPLTLLGERCISLRSQPGWQGPEVDKVGSAILRMLIAHQHSISEVRSQSAIEPRLPDPES